MRPLDWILLAVCAVLLIAGPAMALQELSRYRSESGLEGLTGEDLPVEPAFRGAWRGILLVAVILAGIVGTVVAVRVARQQKVRAVGGRLLALLLAGMTILDLAFLADGQFFQNASYLLRGATIVWLYPAAGILMGGATVRLTELEDAFGER